jgi:hypothetical protein
MQGQTHGVFKEFAPADLTGERRQQWLDAAYQSWWASQNHHTFGYLVYLLLASLGFYVILSFMTVGLASLWVVFGISRTCQLSADWLNRDGRHGWRPMAKVYRTVVQATALLSLAITVTLGVVGLDNLRWISVLAGLYVLFVPLFVMYPRVVFLKVARQAKEDRRKDISAAIKERNLNISRDFPELEPFFAELERCHAADIQPLRLRGSSYSSFMFVVLLPILLGVAQVIVPLFSEK